MKKTLKFNPFSAKSILWAAILAAALLSDDKKGKLELSFEKVPDSKDPSNPLTKWQEEKYHAKIGNPKQSSPLLVHAIFNDDWQKDQSKDVALGFVGTYMDLDKAKVLEIQKRYLKDNVAIDGLATKGRVLKSHPLHALWSDKDVQSKLLEAMKAEAPKEESEEGSENTDKA